MKKPAVSFDVIPASARSEMTLIICLKCAFDLFTKQLKLTPRTAYSELKNHVPEETDFTGASTSRPHFIAAEGLTHCPYCKGAKSWFAQFRALRIDAHPSFEKERRKLWAALKKEAERFTLWQPERTQMQIFSDWLERLKRQIDFDDDHWLLMVGMEHVKHAYPSNAWSEILQSGVRRVQLSRQTEGDWHYENGWLYVAPALYGDILLVQHLLSRAHQHGGRTFEGKLTMQEFINRLRRIGYMEAKGIEAREAYEVFEQAVAKLVASAPSAVYYAVDRSEYLEKLKSVYEKRKKR